MHSLQEPNKIQNEVPQNFEKSMMPRDAVPRHHVMPRQFWSKLPHASFLQKRSIISKSAKELVHGELDFTGTVDTSGEGAGGVWLPGETRLKPTVWRVEWPQEVRDRLVTHTNPHGDITNSDLEMLGALLGWLVLEAITSTKHAHVGMCSDNSATVAWQTRGASRRSRAANRLLRILAVRMRKNRASPLVTKHLAGERNHLGDIPSRSFGYSESWHCETDSAFLKFFDQTFPLPSQNSWTGFQLGSRVVTKCISELLTKGSPMAEWRQLPKLGREFGGSGKPTAKITECVRTWTAKTFKQSPGSPPDSGQWCDAESEGRQSPQEWCARGSAVSTRRSPWTRDASHCTKQMGSTTSSQSN